MGIDAQLRNERGDVVGEVPDARMALSRACGNQFAETRLLKYLVPWGDAVFNQAQAQDLEQDIRILLSTHAGTPLGDALARLQEFVTRLAKESHLYLWFVGN
jgi:hypothetical protein